MSIRIREYSESDWSAVWEMMEPVIRSGESYPYAMDMDADGAHYMWVEMTDSVYVVEEDSGNLLGTYYIMPNKPTLGAPEANCGYVVAERARGQGIGTMMGAHSQEQAVLLGYRAMQFNLVVNTNAVSHRVWNKLGFKEVGVLEGAFLHVTDGYVDATVFYKVLE